ncbi:hypothetical protein AXF42_Ash011186 [Apostasia shenzhenica]|uniref:2-(3-amino-3-carboxypropyl)histidine synthase subunit 2 n=1 Tax=Apostasia shenzhenica TaxID=1088818 RepID=A0A2I0ALC6_9ASPA|nr:hypothetical protein AXF42_Ash011186 [Apostasia shenzhenica]
MDLLSNYEISRTADFIRSRSFTRVALQFPDDLLRDSTKVARALRSELGRRVRLFVMADTAYGSCCVDEVGAAHVDAECVIHYGHACMSPTTTLPAFFVFGKATIDVDDCVQSLHHCLSTNNRPILVLLGLEYLHALQDIKAAMSPRLQCTGSGLMVTYAEVTSTIINPSEDCDRRKGFFLGGLTWSIPTGHKMEEYLLFWIGDEDSAFANMILTLNSCEIVRYDAKRSQLLKDFSHPKKILRRRYYLVEKAKDANIVGILVGTLGVAGFLDLIKQMKDLIEGTGKKSYTLIMGRPNSAKLANFPECDVFVYVSCAQTALLDSKDFLAPVITPYEAVLAFSRAKEWTGEYMLDFCGLDIPAFGSVNHTEEARFSFIRGAYIEDVQPTGNGGQRIEETLALAESTEKALSSSNQLTDSILFKGTARSGAEFFAARSFQGLSLQPENPSPPSLLIGRSGRAAGYADENQQGRYSS